MNEPSKVPWPARVLDVVTVLCALLALSVYLTGGFREYTPFGRLSVTNWMRPAVPAVVLLVLRHWIWRRPILPVRFWRGVVAWWRHPDAALAWPLIFARAGVLAVGFLAVVLIGYAPKAPPWRIYENELHNLPARWDTGWYVSVAEEGYIFWTHRLDRQQNISFFPAYPMLMRYVSLLFARETIWIGVAISFVSFFFAMVYLFRLARSMIGDDSAAAAGVTMLAAYPFALFYSAAYTESLFLLTIVAACYHFERDELWQAAIWGLVAGLTRPNGCLLSVVLALIAVRPLWVSFVDRSLGWRRLLPSFPPPGGWSTLADRVAVAAAPGVGMLIYSTYMYFLAGHPFQWAIQNAAWGRVYRGLDDLVADRIGFITNVGFYGYASTRTIEFLDALAVIFVLVSVWPVFRRFGLPYAVMLLVNVLPPLMMGGLLSMGRVTSVLFPAFLWLGVVVPSRHRTALITVFAMLQGLCAALFFTWRPLF